MLMKSPASRIWTPESVAVWSHRYERQFRPPSDNSGRTAARWSAEGHTGATAAPHALSTDRRTPTDKARADDFTYPDFIVPSRSPVTAAGMASPHAVLI